MWALIAFIALGLIVATLIEINERIKAKKNRDHETMRSRDHEDCISNEDCSACELLSVCDKKSTDEP